MTSPGDLGPVPIEEAAAVGGFQGAEHAQHPRGGLLRSIQPIRLDVALERARQFGIGGAGMQCHDGGLRMAQAAFVGQRAHELVQRRLGGAVAVPPAQAVIADAADHGRDGGEDEPFLASLGGQQRACRHQGADAVHFEQARQVVGLALREGLLGAKVALVQYARRMDCQVETVLELACHSREAVDRFVAPDVDSEYASGLLHFWKGRYYVSILAYPETDSKKLVVQKLGRRIGEQIQGPSIKPQLVNRLPEESLQPHSIKYFSHHTWLNTYHYFSNENLLNIDHTTEVVMATYQVDGPKPAVLILLQYPHEAAASNAQIAFKQAFMADAKADLSVGVDQLWQGCVRDTDLLMIVVDAPDMETARRIVKGVE